ncbi:MAG: GtrA family protein [Gemmataceae bacterium]
MSRSIRRLRRLFTHTSLSFRLYRYRYLMVFTIIGFASILVEIGSVAFLPGEWPWSLRVCLGFLAGLIVSFALNSTFNFRVPQRRLIDTFARFAAVSALSFGLNMLAVSVARIGLQQDYASARLISSAVLFLMAYRLHRRYTFDTARNFGVAVYASASESVYHIFAKLGRNCDHVHVDLVDSTMNPNAAPVQLDHLDRVRRVWPGVPVCLHVMSRTPARWARQVWDRVDWVMFHVDSEDDLFGLIAEARMRGKRVGVVWHVSNRFSELFPYLPHVDLVMVLGIEQPGRSGQKLLDEAVEVASTLDSMRNRYSYDVMFDGGVSPQTLPRIRAKYIVAASAVLRADNPIHICHTLRTGNQYERRAA